MGIFAEVRLKGKVRTHMQALFGELHRGRKIGGRILCPGRRTLGSIGSRSCWDDM